MTLFSQRAHGRGGRKSGGRLKLVSTAAAFGTCMLANSSYAQSTEPAQPQADSSDITIGEIVVTGRKRATTLSETPATAVVLDAELLEQVHVTSLDDVKKVVPSLNLERATGGAVNMNIRGIGTTGSGQALEQSVSIYVNGVYAGGVMRETSWPIYDIDRIEVYSGTQGGIVGQNTSVGQVQIATRRPGTQFGGYFEGGYEIEQQGWTVQGGIDLPVASNFRMRLAGYSELIGGYIRNASTGSDLGESETWSGRLTAVWEPADALTVTGFVEHNSLSYMNQPAPVVRDPAGAYAAYIARLFTWRPDQSMTALFDPASSHGGDPYVEADGTRGSVSLDFDLGGGYALTSATSASQVDDELFNDNDFSDAGIPTTANPRVGQLLFQPSEYDQVTEEIRLSSPTERAFSFIVGGWYRRANWTKTTVFQQYNTNGTVFRADEAYDVTTDNMSLFGDVQYRITDRLSVGGSYRYTWDDKRGILANPDSNYPTQFTAYPRTVLNADASFGDYSGRVQYAFDSGFNVYASYVQSTKAGAIFDLVGSSIFNILPPEQATTAEVGVKYNGASTYAALSAFDMDIENFQDVVTGVVNGVFGFRAQSRSIRHRGAEAQVTVAPVRGLNLSGSALWLPYAEDKTLGGRNTRSPKWALTGGARYTTEVGAQMQASLFTNVSYKDDYYAFPIGNPARTENFVSRSYTLLDVGAELEFQDWTLRLRCGNCTNEYVWASPVRSTFTNPNTGVTSPAYSAILPPLRTIALDARVRF